MIYRAIGLMSGSSLDGLDIAFAEFHENGGKWSYELQFAECFPYSEQWKNRLQDATSLDAMEYQLLHVDYGHYLGEQVNRFIAMHDLHYKVSLIASHGHTTFHVPSRKMTAQLGDGASIAAKTKLPVVTDLRALDVALGGQGAPIVPIGEKLLLSDYPFCLNIGGIANISANTGQYFAFDICPANRVLNLLALDAGQEYDNKGNLASSGKVDDALLTLLNNLDYYKKTFPKSLANEFGTQTIYPLIKENQSNINDALRTYTEHIAIQVKNALQAIPGIDNNDGQKMLVTGGGAFNNFLIERIKEALVPAGVEVVIPHDLLVNYKEALIMGLIGVLRWRQEYNVLSSVTGSERDNIGGALWTGQEA